MKYRKDFFGLFCHISFKACFQRDVSLQAVHKMAVKFSLLLLSFAIWSSQLLPFTFVFCFELSLFFVASSFYCFYFLFYLLVKCTVTSHTCYLCLFLNCPSTMISSLTFDWAGFVLTVNLGNLFLTYHCIFFNNFFPRFLQKCVMMCSYKHNTLWLYF